MEDQIQQPEVSGAGGGKPKKANVTVNQTIVGTTRAPVEQANNLFSVAFAKTVYALAEGELEGFPNSAEKDIYLDSTPIQNMDGTSNFTGYTLDHRLGTDETQTPMSGFSQVENAVGVGVAVTVSNGPITRTITDLDTERCRVIVAHAALQSTNSENGDITGTSVSYRIAVSANGGPYTTVAEPTVSGKSSSEFQRAYEFDLTGTGPWSVRITRLTSDSGSVYLQNGIIWQSYVEIVDEKFAYPNTAVLGLKVDARQFDNIPDVSVRLRGKRVQVPQNYDPVARTYSGLWDGTWKMAWTDNPAWIFRDIVLHPRFGVARYVPTIAIDPWYLYTVSQYCDGMVPNGAGGFEPRFTCNVYLQNPGSVYEVLNSLASVFRGLIYYAEGQLYVTQDRQQIPVQQFSEANVIQEVDESGAVTAPCFSYAGSSKTARKSVCIANWDDPSQNYSSVVEYLQDDVLLERLGYNPVDLRLLGVTSRGQALRAAKHTLFASRYETEKVSFRIAAEGLAAGVGEIIQIADPMRQGQRIGGRIVSINGNDIKLDAVLNLDPGTSYTLTLVVPDGETTTNADGSTVTRPKLSVHNIVSYSNDMSDPEFARMSTQDRSDITTQSLDFIGDEIQVDSLGTTTITVDGIVNAQEKSLWVLEWTSLNASLYRVISVAEVDPLVFQVEALQYNDSKYDYVDNDLPIAVPKDRFTLPTTQQVTDLSARLVFKNGRTQIVATWKCPQVNNADNPLIRGYRYQWRQLGSAEWSEIATIQVTNTYVSLPEHVFGNEYEVRVAPFDRLGRQGDWLVTDVEALADLPDLSNPSYGAVLRHHNQPDGTQLLIADAGSCPLPERVNGYRIWAYPTNVPTVIPGVKEPDATGWYFLCDIPLTGYYTIAFHAPGDWQLRVAFTSSIFGELGTDYIYDIVERDEIVPPTPNRFTVVESSNSSRKRFSWLLPLSTYGSWDQGVVADVVAYEIKYKQGGLVNNSPNETWDVGFDLYSGGVSANQQWFETALFDTGEWTVMVKSVDATQWRSDSPAYIIINVGAPPLSNPVYETTINTTTWPGYKDNCQINGSNELVQIDTTRDARYVWNFDNNELESAVLITTTAVATYQHSLGALSGADTALFQENDNEIWQETNFPIYTEQRTYSAGALSGESSGVLHPYAPYEKLIEDTYQVETVFRSADGSTAGKLQGIMLQLDYEDLIENQNDVSISSSPSGTAIALNKTFRAVTGVQITLQNDGGTAVSAVVLNKTTSAITVKCINGSGTAVAGLIDLTVVGY